MIGQVVTGWLAGLWRLIGDDIEWYFLDTEVPFKCVIESGRGHAHDFMQPTATYP